MPFLKLEAHSKYRIIWLLNGTLFSCPIVLILLPLYVGGLAVITVSSFLASDLLLVHHIAPPQVKHKC